MGKSRVKDKRAKYDKIRAHMRRFGSPTLTVGVHGDSPSYVRGQGSPATGPQVAAFNEFGTLEMFGVSESNNGRVGTPERSFLRSTIDDNEAKYERVVDAAFARVLLDQEDPARALAQIGLLIERDIRERIVTISDPPNAESTLQAKAPKSNPLIRDGQLRQSISSKVSKS